MFLFFKKCTSHITVLIITIVVSPNKVVFSFFSMVLKYFFTFLPHCTDIRRFEEIIKKKNIM